MTNLVTHAHRVCGLLLRLYPTAFRKEFAAEIQDVIGAKLSDASQASTMSVIVVCLQELLDLAVNLLNEYQNQLFQTKGDPHLMSSPGQRSRAILLVVPILLAVFLSVINPHYLLVLFSDPFGWLLAVCFALAVLLNALTMPNRLGVASDPPPRFLIGGWATASMGIFLGIVSMTTLLVGPAIVMVIRLTVVHMLAIQIGYGVIIALDITFAVGVAIAIARTRCVGSQG